MTPQTWPYEEKDAKVCSTNAAGANKYWGALGPGHKAGESREGLQEQTRAQAIALGTGEDLGKMEDIERSLQQGGKAR